MLKRLLLATGLLTTTLLFTGCGGNPGWDGSKPEGKVGEFAELACGCVYDAMREMPDVDVDGVVAKMNELKDKGEDIMDLKVLAKYPELVSTFAMREQIATTVEDGPCLDVVDEKAFNLGLDPGDIQDVLDAHCILTAFFNYE